MVDLDSLNAYILQQVIKKRSSNNVEGSIQDQRKQRDHFLKLIQNLECVSDGQASISYEDDNLTKFIIKLSPRGGPYGGASLLFLFKLPNTYPTTPPNISCKTKLYHPNIDDEGDICLSVLTDWSCNNDLTDCVQGLLYLLYNPNLDDPLSPYFAPGESLEMFLNNVRSSLNGEEVNGVYFPKVL